MPDPEDLGDLLTDLLGKTVTVEPGAPPGEPRTIAHYLGEGRVVACVADLRLSALAGAALATIPAGGTDESLRDGILEPHLRDNAYEVFNVVSTLFNVPGYSHVKLAGFAGPGEFLPREAQLAFSATRDRLDVTVAIEHYGSGQLEVLTAWEAA